MSETQDLLNMTASTIGRDILQSLVQEIKLLPNVWPKMSEKKQNDVLDRLRSRVDHNVKMAVHLIASDGRTVVTGYLDQITIKDGVKAVVKFSSTAPNLHELYEASGKAVLLVVANPESHTGGMDEVRGESDQRAMDLGKEYDPNGDGKGMPGAQDDDGVLDVQARAFPDTLLEAQLEEAEEDGYQAAADGKTQSDCPVMRGELCIAWTKGWKRWHEINPAEAVPTKKGDMPNDHGVYICDPDETISWEKGKDWCDIELLELENGEWLHAISKHFGTGEAAEPIMRRSPAPSRKEAIHAAQSRLVEIYARGEQCGLKGKAFESFRAWVNDLAKHAVASDDLVGAAA